MTNCKKKLICYFFQLNNLLEILYKTAAHHKDSGRGSTAGDILRLPSPLAFPPPISLLRVWLFLIEIKLIIVYIRVYEKEINRNTDGALKIIKQEAMFDKSSSEFRLNLITSVQATTNVAILSYSTIVAILSYSTNVAILFYFTNVAINNDLEIHR